MNEKNQNEAPSLIPFTVLRIKQEALYTAATSTAWFAAPVQLFQLVLEEKLYDSHHELSTDPLSLLATLKSRFGGIQQGDIIMGQHPDKHGLHAWLWSGGNTLSNIPIPDVHSMHIPVVSPQVLVLQDEPVVRSAESKPETSKPETSNPETSKLAPEANSECVHCTAQEARRPRAVTSSTLTVGEMRNTRNVSREEMQGILQKAIGEVFTREGIPLTQDHFRRALRCLFRIAVRMGMEQNLSLERNLVPLLLEAVTKESQALGKPVKARTLGVYAVTALEVTPKA